MNPVFRTKYDWWIVAFLVLATFAGFAAVFDAAMNQQNFWPVTWVPALLLLIWWPIGTIRYEIATPDLIIYADPFRFRVPLESIQAIYPSHNPLSSPAASLDRLRIDYLNKSGKKRFALVSPRDKKGFLQAIADAVPELEIEGRRVVRRGVRRGS